MYQDVVANKYASKEIVENFSDVKRYTTWRLLWIALAREQKALGLNISNAQIEAMEHNYQNIDFLEVEKIEAELQHDVMAHLTHFANQNPIAKPIMHLGATSEFIKDNTDLILMKNALLIIREKLVATINSLIDFAIENKNVATLGYTHYQVAQPTTVGRRACLWLQSFMIDLEQLDSTINSLKFRGVKGTTGTLASFKDLFNNNYQQVKLLNENITKHFGFKHSFIITGQTYDRKVDVNILNLISSIAVSAHKFTNDLRLLQNLKELQEGFGKNQVGSSAMPYKKNPIKSERVSSLAKYLIALPFSASMVASTQWLERTLDDSANRRITIPQGFFTLDAILKLITNIISNIQVNHKVIAGNLNKELPFLATENIMMMAVKKGGDRQILHEKIRAYAMEVHTDIVENGSVNTLLDKILADSDFNLSPQELQKLVNVDNFIGFSKEQVDDYIGEVKEYLKNIR